jgi:hypothetical protein
MHFVSNCKAKCSTTWVGQNHIHTTVYDRIIKHLVIFLPSIPYMHRMNVWPWPTLSATHLVTTHHVLQYKMQLIAPRHRTPRSSAALAARAASNAGEHVMCLCAHSCVCAFTFVRSSRSTCCVKCKWTCSV